MREPTVPYAEFTLHDFSSDFPLSCRHKPRSVCAHKSVQTHRCLKDIKQDKYLDLLESPHAGNEGGDKRQPMTEQLYGGSTIIPFQSEYISQHTSCSVSVTTIQAGS